MNNWQPSSGIEPTPELMDIITCNTSVSVLACAGAGKTELLAQKANYLLTTGQCAWPKRVLSLTFKTEAQINIKERVKKRCGESASRFDSFTFHAFCKSIVDRFKNILQEDERPSDNYDIVFERREANGNSKILMESLLDLALQIFSEREDIRAMFSRSYSHIFVDEFQDTTNKQYELLKLLFMNSDCKVLSVGDLNQSIMLWADARATVFQDFLVDFSAEQKFLLKNYRASREIGTVLDVFVEYMRNPKEDVRTLVTPPTNCSVAIFSNEIQEATFVANKVRDLIASGVDRQEICILTKQHSDKYTEKIRAAFTRFGIEYVDMNELQDALKEPLGKLFSLFLKSMVTPTPKVMTEVYDLVLSLNKVQSGDEKERELILLVSSFMADKRAEIEGEASVDKLISCILGFVRLLGKEKIKGRWKQYRSPGYYTRVWNILESHLREMCGQARNLKDAIGSFHSENSVHIMNIHKCKGLEYEYVYFIGLEDQAFWTYQTQKFENNCAIYVALSRAKLAINVTFTLSRPHRSYSYNYDNRPSTSSSLSEVYNVLLNRCHFAYLDHTGDGDERDGT